MTTIKAIEARLPVTDVKRSAAFYSDVLGLHMGTLWPDDRPEFAILNRDRGRRSRPPKLR
jgi:catechol 2,3-dioxygenase-like lactoylglutathione lyase family enzyme